MITDAHHVYSGFTPAAFDSKLRFQEEIIYKSFNEQYNSFQELKALKARLVRETNNKRKRDLMKDPLSFMFLKGDLYSLLSLLVRDFLKNREASLLQEIIQEETFRLPKGLSHHEQIVYTYRKLLHEDEDYQPLSWLYKNISNVIKENESKIALKEQDRDSKNRKTFQMQRARTRQLYLKQLADVVESITGAVAIACGLNFT